MDKKIYNIFDQVHAEKALKQKTSGFLLHEIEKKRNRAKTLRLRNAYAIAAFSVAALVCILSYGMYIFPSAYIDIDVNPSVELALNRFGRVITASPYNADGNGVLQIETLRNSTYTEAVKEILNSMAAQGYLEQDGLLSLTVQSSKPDVGSKMLSELEATVNSVLQSSDSGISSEVFAVSKEVKKHAHQHSVSPAKYLAITELQRVDPTATFSGCSNHSISELRYLARENGGGPHAGNHAADDGSRGSGKGRGGHHGGKH